jgi:hypothetical protein
MMRRMPAGCDDDWEELLRGSPPAPEAWVERAIELPQLERALEILNKSQDAEDVHSALRQVGLEPDDRRLRSLQRLRDLRSAD